MSFDTVLFDLDGTLVDTAPEIADAVNDTLRRRGLPAADDDTVRAWIGDGARALLGKALRAAGVPEGRLAAEVEAAWPGFSLDYGERCGTRGACFPGVIEALTALQAAGVRLAVITNKESAFAHRVIARRGLSPFFELIVAGDTLARRKPHADGVHHALAALQGRAARTLLVGDSATDVRTARAAGITVWTVPFGYHHGGLQGEDTPDRRLEGFHGLAAAVTAARPRAIAIA